jgi:lysophospholipase L1-like esterase
MHHILVYGDSLSWGIVPGTRRRLPFADRWAGVMERLLVSTGRDVRVTEDCLNGRRTVLDDPFKPGRNGRIGLEQRVEVNSPLDLVVLMLGTNDLQSMHQFVAWHAAQGVAALVQAVRQAPIEPEMPVPRILIVAPPPLQEPRGPLASKFAGAPAKGVGLAEALAVVARELGCEFVDAGPGVRTSAVDGIHLDAEQHAALGSALAGVVGRLLPSR